MKIQLVSDLHLEFSDIIIKNENDADVLILSGDILVGDKLLINESEDGIRFRNFLKRCSFQFPTVVYVAGNHELYGGKFYKTLEDIKTYCLNNFTNVHFLEQSYVDIKDVTFIGGTLWTDMNKGDPVTLHSIRNMMNDFKTIRNDLKGYTALKPYDTAIRHKETLEYFKRVLADRKDKKCVVVGHHSPSHLSIHATYRDQHYMNGGYHSDLSNFILDHPQVKLWTHGHTHHCFDYVIGETRILCNPRGYETDRWKEDTGWNPNLTVEI